MYINDPPPTLNTLPETILFSDDTSEIISSKNFDHFSTISNTVLSHMSKWFTSNRIGCDEKYKEKSNTKFLGLQIDNNLN
jgi:hypothetical protein